LKTFYDENARPTLLNGRAVLYRVAVSKNTPVI